MDSAIHLSYNPPQYFKVNKSFVLIIMSSISVLYSFSSIFTTVETIAIRWIACTIHLSYNQLQSYKVPSINGYPRRLMLLPAPLKMVDIKFELVIDIVLFCGQQAKMIYNIDFINCRLPQNIFFSTIPN